MTLDEYLQLTDLKALSKAIKTLPAADRPAAGRYFQKQKKPKKPEPKKKQEQKPILWSCSREPFGFGMEMRENELLIRAKGRTIIITGKDIKIK